MYIRKLNLKDIMKLVTQIFILALFLIIPPSSLAQNALDFDGTNDYVMMTAAGPSGTANRTVEAWIKTSTSQQQQQILVDWGTMAQGTRFTFNIIAFGKLRIEIGGNGFNSTASVADGQWHHVAVTYDNSSASKAKLYIDGFLDASNNFTVIMNSSSSGPIILGRRNDNVNYYEGLMDEVRIWDYAKTATQITAGMNNTACGNTTGLVAYYNFNHGTAGGNNATVTTLVDYANTNNGILNNFALSGGSSNWLAGKSLASASADSVVIIDSLCDGYKYYMGPYTYSQPGMYVDTLSNSTGCDSVIYLTLHPKSTDATAGYVNQSFEANNTNPGVTYQWVNCLNWGILVGETNQQFFPTNNDEYAVFVTENDCIDTSDCMSLLYASLEESPWNGLNIYPNPAEDRLRITLEESVGDLELSIFDLKGRLMLNQTLKGLSNTIHIESLETGLYIVKLTNSETSFSHKIYVK